MQHASNRSQILVAALAFALALVTTVSPAYGAKPSPDEAIAQLREGNERFVAGESNHPNTDVKRLIQAGKENQGDHAFATVITCSDSRVPVERLFDAGVMDIFVIRVAGNVCDTDEVGSIEYGLAHVNTPVLVVLGHKQCGAVTAVTAAVQGQGHKLERNIPPLVDNIEPAVHRAIAAYPGAEGSELVEAGIVENVWQSIEDLYRTSPATRELVKSGKVKVVGAIYDVGTGEIEWLPESKSEAVLTAVESDATRAMNVYADSGHGGEATDHGGEATAGHADGQSGSVSIEANAKDMGVWVGLLGTPGTFTAPGVEHVARVPFGAEAATADHSEILQSANTSDLVVNLFWGFTAVAFVITLLAGFRLTKLKGQDDSKSRRGFTLGTKVTLAMGGLATLILLVSSLSITSQNVTTRDIHEYVDIVSEAELLAGLQRDVLMVRMNVKDFLITNSDKDLEQYSHFIANALEKILACEEEITDSESMKMAKEVDHLIKEYEEHFAAVVAVIDERNGTVTGQLNPTGARLTDLLHAIIETAQHDGDAHAALNAAEALGRLTLARVGVMKYLRTGIESDAEFAIGHLEVGEHELRQLSEEVQNPTRLKWLSEADEGYLFYAKRVKHLIELVDQRHEIVEGELDRIGPQIASTANELIETIHEREKELQAEIDTNANTARIEAIVISLVATALAFCVTVLLVRTITRGIGNVISRLKDIAQGEGDLTQRVDQDRKDELGELGKWFNVFVEKMHDIISEVVSGVREVAGASTQIAAASEEMATGMTEQSSQVTQISSAVEQMSASVIEVARKSSEAANNAQESGKVALEGGQVVNDTIQGMNQISEAVNSSAASVSELGKRGEQIGQIIEVINDIADQTNLLALNAAIEAARAGEHGRGFAVVADEVRKLADRTTKATEEIGDSINAIQTETDQAVQRMNAGTDQVQTGVEKATEAGRSLEKIVSGAREVATMIESIAASAEEQSSASNMISSNLESISAVTNEASEGARQSASAAAQLSSKAEQLQQMVGQFKIRG